MLTRIQLVKHRPLLCQINRAKSKRSIQNILEACTPVQLRLLVKLVVDVIRKKISLAAERHVKKLLPFKDKIRGIIDNRVAILKATRENLRAILSGLAPVLRLFVLPLFLPLVEEEEEEGGGTEEVSENSPASLEAGLPVAEHRESEGSPTTDV